MIKGYTIIIPILNEGKNIIKIIGLIKKTLNKKKYEVIFCDDNSSDDTLKILNKNSKKNIRYLIHYGRNDLYQSAIMGIKKSLYDNIIIMDGDMQHHPRYLNKIIKLFEIKNSDLVIACRNFDKQVGLSLLRKISSIIIIKISKLMLKIKTDDPMSGFFLFKKKLFTNNEKKIYGKGFKILLDLLSLNRNCSITDFKIIFRRREKNISKMNLKILIQIVFLLTLRSYNRIFRSN